MFKKCKYCGKELKEWGSSVCPHCHKKQDISFGQGCLVVLVIVVLPLFLVLMLPGNEEFDNNFDDGLINESDNGDNLKILSQAQKENFKIALNECNIQSDKIKNITKLEDWSNGSRYSFTYNGDILYLYINDDDTISSINLSLGGLKIYDEKYESLNYNNYYISMDMSIKMEARAESSVDMYLKDSSSANYKWTNYQRTSEYYAISGSVTANNSFGQPISNTVYVEFKYQNDSLSVIYISLNGSNTYGSKVVPEIKRKERRIVDTSTDEKIILNDGVVGNYGKYDTFDGKKYLRFYVPAGKYQATALVKNSMFYVESIKLHKEDGYDVPTTYETVSLNKKGDIKTIEVKNGQCISLVMGTKIELVKIK